MPSRANLPIKPKYRRRKWTDEQNLYLLSFCDNREITDRDLTTITARCIAMGFKTKVSSTARDIVQRRIATLRQERNKVDPAFQPKATPAYEEHFEKQFKRLEKKSNIDKAAWDEIIEKKNVLQRFGVTQKKAYGWFNNRLRRHRRYNPQPTVRDTRNGGGSVHRNQNNLLDNDQESDSDESEDEEEDANVEGMEVDFVKEDEISDDEDENDGIDESEEEGVDDDLANVDALHIAAQNESDGNEMIVEMEEDGMLDKNIRNDTNAINIGRDMANKNFYELAVGVESDFPAIRDVSEEEKKTIFEVERARLAETINELQKKRGGLQPNVRAILTKVQTILRRFNVAKPLKQYGTIIATFREAIVTSPPEDAMILLKIYEVFAEGTAKAFCCGAFLKSTPVEYKCEEHGDSCILEDGDQYYRSEFKIYCKDWHRDHGRPGTKLKIQLTAEPESYEQCSFCNRIWHPKCRLTRLLRDPNSCPCKNSNDQLEFPRLADGEIPSTIATESMNKTYEKNRGSLPAAKFVQSHAIKKSVNISQMYETILGEEKYKAVFGDQQLEFEYVEKQFYAVMDIDGVETCTFTFSVQEYGEGGLKNGWVVIDYLDSVAIFKNGRSYSYKRMIYAYLNSARERGFKWAHLYALAPNDGEDYLFGCHPLGQIYLCQKDLEDWYKNVFNWTKEGVPRKIRLEENRKILREFLNSENSVSSLCQKLIFGNSFWNDEIGKIFVELSSNIDTDIIEVQSFKEAIEKRIDQFGQKLFYFTLDDSNEVAETTKETELFACHLTHDSEHLLEEHYKNKLEFTTLRQAQYASRQILAEIYLESCLRKEEKQSFSTVFSQHQVPVKWIEHH